MSEVTFKFDAIEDADEIRYIVDRYKVIKALDELQNFRRCLYKGYYTESDYCLVLEDDVEVENFTGQRHKVKKAVKLVTDEDTKQAQAEGKPYVEGAVSYLKSEWVENRINSILDEISHLL